MCLRVHARLAVHYLCAYLDLLCTCKLHAYVTYLHAYLEKGLDHWEREACVDH